MPDPNYQPDVKTLAEELSQTYGPGAFEVAVEAVRTHMQASAWKHCALWLQVVNRLNGAPRSLSTQ